MGLNERDYVRGKHPPTCTCKECVKKRLISQNAQRASSGTAFSVQDKNGQTNDNPVKPSGNQNKPFRYPAWLLVLVLIFASSLIGFAFSYIVGTSILFWLLFGGSIIYSIEHWYYQQTRRHRNIGKVYRALINLSVFSLLVLVVWSGIHLFTQSFHSNPIIGVIVFIIEIGFLLWLFKVANRNKWRWPSLKLTFFTILVITTILAFAGVQPFKHYKDTTVSEVSSFFKQTVKDSNDETIIQENLSGNEVLAQTVDSISDSQETSSNEFLDNIKNILTASTIDTNNLVPGSSFIDDRSIFSSIDQHALNAPESVAQSIDALIEYLIQPATDDLEKARVIYRWITKNISYDFSAYLTGSYGSTSPDDVLVNRSSVCQGYSNLFKKLAESAGLKVVTISGWAKGYSYEAGDLVGGPSNHAWNAIQLNDGWYLIDSTWGSGSIMNGEFVREFDEWYFLTPPDKFVYNHFPEDTKWQLQTNPISRRSFTEIPYVHSNFFLYGIEFGENDKSIIETTGDMSIYLPVPNDTYLMSRLEHDGAELPESHTSDWKVSGKYQIDLRFPKSGSYVLTIFARKDSQYGYYDGVLEYKIIVNK